jgi:hypothetical protein
MQRFYCHDCQPVDSLLGPSQLILRQCPVSRLKSRDEATFSYLITVPIIFFILKQPISSYQPVLTGTAHLIILQL